MDGRAIAVIEDELGVAFPTALRELYDDGDGRFETDRVPQPLRELVEYVDLL